MSGYRVIQSGESRSFPSAHPFLDAAVPEGAGLALVGRDAGETFRTLGDTLPHAFVAIELGMECLGVHTGESRGDEGSNVVGFARYRLGRDAPTRLVEVVRQPNTSAQALAGVRAAFASAGLVVAVCNDFPGRIVDRLVRPYYNDALRRLDERLASADDLDKTLCLGLGYPEGPIALLERTGLDLHHDVSNALFHALGQHAYAPARRAQVARQRVDAMPAASA